MFFLVFPGFRIPEGSSTSACALVDDFVNKVFGFSSSGNDGAWSVKFAEGNSVSLFSMYGHSNEEWNVLKIFVDSGR